MSKPLSDKPPMLTITRKRNESIRIGYGEGVLITVVEIHGDKVRLGVDAKKTVGIARQHRPE